MVFLVYNICLPIFVLYVPYCFSMFPRYDGPVLGRVIFNYVHSNLKTNLSSLGFTWSLKEPGETWRNQEKPGGTKRNSMSISVPNSIPSSVRDYPVHVNFHFHFRVPCEFPCPLPCSINSVVYKSMSVSMPLSISISIPMPISIFHAQIPCAKKTLMLFWITMIWAGGKSPC